MTKRKRPPLLDPPYLDEEERSLIEGWKRGEYASLSLKEERSLIDRAQADARAYRLANNEVALQVPAVDMDRLKRKARGARLPYRQYMAQILSRFANGELVPKV